MGYRSTVVNTIVMPSMDFLTSWVIRAANEGKLDKEAMDWVLENSRICKTPAIPSRWVSEKMHYSLPAFTNMYVWEFMVDDVKWYESYPDIEFVESLIKDAKSKGLPGVFIRIGEDTTDIEQDTYDSSEDDFEEYASAINLFGDTVGTQFGEYVKLMYSALDDIPQYYTVCRHWEFDGSLEQEFVEANDLLKDLGKVANGN